MRSPDRPRTGPPCPRPAASSRGCPRRARTALEVRRGVALRLLPVGRGQSRRLLPRDDHQRLELAVVGPLREALRLAERVGPHPGRDDGASSPVGRVGQRRDRMDRELIRRRDALALDVDQDLRVRGSRLERVVRAELDQHAVEREAAGRILACPPDPRCGPGRAGACGGPASAGRPERPASRRWGWGASRRPVSRRRASRRGA